MQNWRVKKARCDMKKIFIAVMVGASFLASSFALSVSLTNTFGSDKNNTKANDFLVFDKDFNKPTVSVGDRIQLDVASEKIDSRIRFDITDKLAITGYVNFRPVEWLNFIGGNKFFSNWGIPAAYLAASDDTVNHGKLADNDGFGVVFDFAGFKFSTSFAAESRLNLNFGTSYALKNVMNIGFTAQNVTEDSRSFGFFAGLDCVKNLKLNVGYVYNYNNSDYLPATQNAIQLSTAYKIEDIGLSLAADVQLGLNNKKGDGSETSYEQEEIPYYAAVVTSYRISKDLTLSLKGIVKHGLNSENDTNYMLYSYADYNTSVGSFRLGVRPEFNTEGFKSLSIPFCWKYKIGYKK